MNTPQVGEVWKWADIRDQKKWMTIKVENFLRGKLFQGTLLSFSADMCASADKDTLITTDIVGRSYDFFWSNLGYWTLLLPTCERFVL